MRADDDGFINNPKKLQRMVGCGEDDLKLLMVKKFILVFESGVIVIIHWKIHNYIRSDRYKPTLYQEEKNQIVEKNSKAYRFKGESSVSGQPADYQRLPQESIVQSKLGQSQGSSSENDCLKTIYHFYEENGFGTPVSYTLGIAVDRNKRNYGYVNAILKSWEQQNYLSVHEVLVNDKKQVLEHTPQMTEEYQELGF